ncbi:tape measure protein [Shinella daejeonensis]|uniref:tape measure protein n=1 Tax=Shinella daejeonensis TaxID=659017 RepID=UPI0020C76E42|nr:tape measure protein [Shinella daejeonensis]MCP8895352.1 tape measure protein [Shinella daejeonensis]
MTTEVAALGLKVSSDSVPQATDRLKDFTEAATKADVANDNLSKSSKKASDAKGKLAGEAGKAASATNKVGDAANKSQGAFARIATGVNGVSGALVRLASVAIGGFFAAFSVGALASIADAWSDMQSRVGAAVKNMEAAPALMQRMVDVANASYSPLSQTVETYSRNVTVLGDLGKSAQEAADFTESLNHMLVLTATRGERAASVQNALSKAMAVGKLQADGLETILANGGEVAQALAKELGTTVNGLRGLASQGKITGQVIADAIIKPLNDVRERAGEMPATISDAFVRIGTNFTALIGTMDQMTGASSAVAGVIISVADGIRWLSQNTETLQRTLVYAGTAVTAFGTYYAGAMAIAAASTWTLNGALAFLRAALLRTGILALVVMAGELVYQFTRLVDGAGSFGNAMGLLGDVASEVWERIKLDGESLVLGLSSLWQKIQAAFLTMLAVMQAGWAEFISAVVAGMSYIPGMGDATTSLQEYANSAKKNFEETAQAATNAYGEANRLMAESDAKAAAAMKPLESLAALNKAMAEADKKRQENLGGAALDNLGGGGGVAAATGGKGSTKKDPYAELVRSSQQFIEQQKLEAQTIGMTAEAANKLRYEQDMLNKAANDNIRLTAAQKTEIAGLAQQMANTEANTKRLKEAFDFAKDATKGFITDLRTGLQNGEGFFKSFANAAMNLLNKVISKIEDELVNALFSVGGASGGAGGLFGGLLGGLGKLFGFADGGAFQGGVQTFAKGGAFTNQIVNRPTPFRFSRGAGLMGEAGPEAIMPLGRDANGRLGVYGAANQNNGGIQYVVVEVQGNLVEKDGQISAVIDKRSQKQVQKAAPGIINAAKQQAVPAMAEYQANVAGSEWR